MNSKDYKRGYSNGYNAGKTSADKRLAQMHDRQQRLAGRVERAENKAGIGHCEDCAFWERGCSNCAWGYCGASGMQHAGTPWGTWAKPEPETKLMTTPRFGCVLFAIRVAHDEYPTCHP